jgi:hypothetical protein
MYHKQLVNHVVSKRREGMQDEVIKTELTADGWTKDDIDEAFYYGNYPGKLFHFSFWRSLHSEVPAFITVILLVIILCGIGAVAYAYKNYSVNYTVNIEGPTPNSRTVLSYGADSALSDPDFFGKVRQQFIDDKADFVEADLTTMKIQVYKAGVVSLQVPIQSKGREGSWWETPAGLYRIDTKEKAHFSGMGHVWMPWSMNFQGNFYIHGRTYYPDGTLTSKTYTGGCIRLETDDAKKVFDAVRMGTPLLVFEHSFSADNFTYDDKISELEAPIFLAADLQNNHVFASKESTKEVPIASITKLMTALIATEYINLDNTATVPKSALVYTSKSRLQEGSQYSVYQLLFPLLMESSNEAAETIARFYGRSAFVKHMNDKAASIGMTHTKFADPSGASEENISTAEDLFMLAKYIYNNRSFIFKITSGELKDSAYGTSGFTDLGNFNDFLTNQYFFGGKNGKTTAALETNLSVFEFPTGETKRPVVTIILKSPNEKNDSERLLEYVLTHFR